MKLLARHTIARTLALAAIAAVASTAAQAARLVESSAATPAAAETAPLQLVSRTLLPGYRGDFDHLAADVAGHRLFVAGEDGGTLEVFDLLDGRHLRTIPDMQAPHALRWLPASRRLLVTHSDGDGLPTFLDGEDFRRLTSVQLPAGTDAMGFDASTGHAWIVAGGRNARPAQERTTIAEVDVGSGRMLAAMPVDTGFVEGIAVEKDGPRMFVNLAGRSEVAVFDKHTHGRLATWPLSSGRENSAIGLDEADHRLFVVTRKPFRLLVLDTRNGATVANLPAPARTNDLFYDAASHRVYLTGDDYVATFEQRGTDPYRELPRVPSAKGAKTGLLVPELGLLCVAVAGTDATPAALLRYRAGPANQR